MAICGRVPWLSMTAGGGSRRVCVTLTMAELARRLGLSAVLAAIVLLSLQRQPAFSAVPSPSADAATESCVKLLTRRRRPAPRPLRHQPHIDAKHETISSPCDRLGQPGGINDAQLDSASIR